MESVTPKIQDFITALGLQPHVEGGYFRRTFQADQCAMLETAGGPRYPMTSIYYRLTEQSPVGQFHFNQSGILHFSTWATRSSTARSLQTVGCRFSLWAATFWLASNYNCMCMCMCRAESAKLHDD